jgi:TonB-dependent SusC/RagA subfamily outer membrane receptor
MPKKITFLSRYTLVALLITLISATANSQTQVSGKVTGPDSKPVFGASVTVKSTNIATSTAQDGSFTVMLPAGKKILVISYVGYEVSEVNVSGNTVDVTMKTQATTLNEVVITGYTAQRKKELTGAVSVVKTADLTKVASPSFLGQMQGRASGVLTTSSGAPGSAVSLRIRGNSTFNEGGGDPLVIVDGMQIRSAFLNQLNPNDIESIQVLKDAATTASYGIGANAGVIIISTKKGKAGTARVDVSSYYGTQASVKTYEDQMLKTSAEYADLVYQSYKNAGLWPQPANSNIGTTYGVGPTPVLPAYVNPLPSVAGGPINTCL